MTIVIKQGESFILDGQYLEDDGVTPKSLAGVTLKSQVRNKGSAVLATLTITILDESLGTYRINAPDGTLSWPVGAHDWDIKESAGGVDRITDTLSITVEKAITRI